MDTITVYRQKINTKMVLHNDSFQYHPNGKAPWLQRVCFYILKKLKAYAIIPDEQVERIVISPKNVIQNIADQRRGLLQNGHPEELEVFIGPEQIHELKSDFNNYMTFSAPVGYGDKIMGMDVTIVPWMSGVICVPKNRKRVK